MCCESCFECVAPCWDRDADIGNDLSLSGASRGAEVSSIDSDHFAALDPCREPAELLSPFSAGIPPKKPWYAVGD